MSGGFDVCRGCGGILAVVSKVGESVDIGGNKETAQKESYQQMRAVDSAGWLSEMRKIDVI